MSKVAAFNIDKNNKQVGTLNGFTLTDNGNRVYTTAFKPTAADIEALHINAGAFYSKVHDSRNTVDELNGLGINAAHVRFDFKYNSTNGFNQGGEFNGVMTFRAYGNNTDQTGNATHQMAFGDNGRVGVRYGKQDWSDWDLFYSTKNPPTAKEVGAAETNHTHYEYAPMSHTHNDYALKGTTVNGMPLSGNITLRAADVKARPDTWTPTAAEVGALPLISGKITQALDIASGPGAQIKTHGGTLSTFGSGDLSLMANTYAFLSAPNSSHFCQNSYYDGGWKKHNINASSTQFVIAESGVIVRCSDAGQSNVAQRTVMTIAHSGDTSVSGHLTASNGLYDSGQRVYSPANKPTAEDLGIVTSGFGPEGGEITGKLTINNKHNTGLQATYGTQFRFEGMKGIVDTILNNDGNGIAFHAGHLYEESEIMNFNAAYRSTSFGGEMWGNADFILMGTGQAVGGWEIFSFPWPRDKVATLSEGSESWLDKVCSLKASSYSTKRDNSRLGFVAEDVQAVLPEATAIRNIAKKGKEPNEQLSIDPMAIIAAQNEAIKELTERLIALESKLNKEA